MSRRLHPETPSGTELALLAAALLLLTAALVALTAPAAASAPAGGRDRAGVTVALDRARTSVGPGEEVRFESTVRNVGDRPASGLVAHLNILTTDPDVYVDPEDWSPRRTQYLDRLDPGESVRLTWDVQAVTSGPLVLYVAVTDETDRTVTASPPLSMTVGGQRVVDAGGVLPLVLWMPAGVAALLGATLLRRRRHR